MRLGATTLECRAGRPTPGQSVRFVRAVLWVDLPVPLPQDREASQMLALGWDEGERVMAPGVGGGRQGHQPGRALGGTYFANNIRPNALVHVSRDFQAWVSTTVPWASKKPRSGRPERARRGNHGAP